LKSTTAEYSGIRKQESNAVNIMRPWLDLREVHSLVTIRLVLLFFDYYIQHQIWRPLGMIFLMTAMTRLIM
jgi:hypothetical protein